MGNDMRTVASITSVGEAFDAKELEAADKKLIAQCSELYPNKLHELHTKNGILRNRGKDHPYQVRYVKVNDKS